MENNLEVPQKIKNRTIIQSSHSNSGSLYKENEDTNLKRYMHPYVHYSIIYNSQGMAATQVSIHRWMDKEDVGDFPGGPVVKTPLFQCRGRGFDPWSGN